VSTEALLYKIIIESGFMNKALLRSFNKELRSHLNYNNRHNQIIEIDFTKLFLEMKRTVSTEALLYKIIIESGFMNKALLRSFNKELRRAKVEPEGVEPSSKQGTYKLSTCLFCDWFSIMT
jgi:hypothetical protein